MSRPNWKQGRYQLWILASLTAVTFCLHSSVLADSAMNDLIVLDSKRGEELLFSSLARKDYLPLSLEFVTQDNLAYCGVATLVMVLNALDIDAPEVPSHTIPGTVSYRFFTQDNVFENSKTQEVIKPEVIRKQGMTLQELAGLFDSYPVQVQKYHAGEISFKEFRQLAVQNLEESGNFLVINYLRRGFGQKGGGHISPIAAYNQASDQFLILDVARYRYSPVWVDAIALWEAMNTLDRTSGKTRGFLLIDR